MSQLICKNLKNGGVQMKRIKLLAMITIISILCIMIAPKAYAADENFQLQLEASSITLHPGDTFSVDIIMDNINVTSGDQGIGAYQAKIIYDTKVLELVSVTPATGWEVLEKFLDSIQKEKD